LEEISLATEKIKGLKEYNSSELETSVKDRIDLIGKNGELILQVQELRERFVDFQKMDEELVKANVDLFNMAKIIKDLNNTITDKDYDLLQLRNTARVLTKPEEEL
jgi:hypothetical protein